MKYFSYFYGFYIKKTYKLILGFFFIYSLLFFLAEEFRYSLCFSIILFFPFFLLFLSSFEEKNAKSIHFILISELKRRTYLYCRFLFPYFVSLFTSLFLAFLLYIFNEKEFSRTIILFGFIFSFCISNILIIADCLTCGIGQKKEKLVDRILSFIPMIVMFLVNSFLFSYLNLVESLIGLESWFFEDPILNTGILFLGMLCITVLSVEMAKLEIEQIDF